MLFKIKATRNGNLCLCGIATSAMAHDIMEVWGYNFNINSTSNERGSRLGLNDIRKMEIGQTHVWEYDYQERHKSHATSHSIILERICDDISNVTEINIA